MQKVIKGQIVNYEVCGRGPALLVLHGWRGNLQHWVPVAEKLKDRYKVFVLDLLGFGNSPKPNLDWTIFDYAEFVANFIQELKLKKVTVMGHSFGGRIALVLASKYQSLVEKLILVDAAGMEIKSLKSQLLKIIRPIKHLLPESIRNKYRSKDYLDAGEMKQIFLKTINQNLYHELSNIFCPTLIIWGEKDQVLSLQEAKMLKNGIKNSILRIVWNGTHWPHFDHPTKLINILKEEL